MTKTKAWLLTAVMPLGLVIGIGTATAQQAAAPPAPAAPAVTINDTSIGGVVTSSKGPEGGVWVIAETTDLPTKYDKIVVTDDQGRYVLPDLPKANYQVWVRGYGLVDSAKVKATPGQHLNLTAVIAPTAAAAAQYYPSVYWYSMLKIPDKTLFPGTGPNGNGIPIAMKTQEDWLNLVKTNGCVTCHQLGDQATRAIPAALGKFDNTVDAWERRLQSGQASGNMVTTIGNFNTQLALQNFADWTDSISKGALPASTPPRPQGVERNVVITEWAVSSPTTYIHDSISTDKRNPTVNANGLIYSSPELSSDNVPTLDPVKNVASSIHEPVLDPKTPNSKDENIQFAPSPYFGDQLIWNSQSIIHNAMFDEQARIWLTARIRPADDPAFCKAGSDNKYAQYFPLANSGRQLSVYDPKTQKFTLIDTCFSTMHLQFGFDAENTLWTSGGGTVLGWLDTKKYFQTGDAAQSQGWVPFIVDTVGDGKPHAWTEPGQPTDPTKDVRVNAGFYAVSPSPVDGTVWGTNNGNGWVVRVNLGANPPSTAFTEIYKVPLEGAGIRGGDIDSKGVFWAGLSGGQFASFDRSKCKGPLNGPNAASGNLCPEGWTLYPFPAPQFADVADKGSAEASYYTWVDQHNTSGLGADTPIATGNESDALFALVNGKFVTLRVPYPMGFFTKNLDGRIDDPNAGWKGRELWVSNGERTPEHQEGGAGSQPETYQIQIRPDPLAF